MSCCSFRSQAIRFDVMSSFLLSGHSLCCQGSSLCRGQGITLFPLLPTAVTSQCLKEKLDVQLGLRLWCQPVTLLPDRVMVVFAAPHDWTLKHEVRDIVALRCSVRLFVQREFQRQRETSEGALYVPTNLLCYY